MPLFAAIDVGSHTLRILIAEFAGNRLLDVYAERKITRLGNMVDTSGAIQTDNWALSINALSEFSSMIHYYGVGHVAAVATSALREARNSSLFLRQVREQTGIQIEVISGEEEARLTLAGVLLGLSQVEERTVRQILPLGQQVNAIGSSPSFLFIMDIGGGSSEWILYRGENGHIIGSIPSGVIKIARNCITSDPVSESDLDLLDAEIGHLVRGLAASVGHLMAGSHVFIGTGGTFTTLASVDLGLDVYSRKKTHLHRIPLATLREMWRKFVRLPLLERKKIRGLEPERADLIIPGLQFTMKVMEFFHFYELIISEYGLLEGVLREMKEKCEEGFPETGKP